MKHEMLPTDHPIVIGRLLHELKTSSAGFYACGPRYDQARFRNGKIEARIAGETRWVIINYDQAFIDGDGKQILVDHSL